MSLQEENYQTLLNILASTIRTGQLESGLSSNSKLLSNKTVLDLFNLFKKNTKVINKIYKLDDLKNFSSMNIDKTKLVNIYLSYVGDLILSSLSFDIDNNIIVPESYEDYLQNDIIITYIDYLWLEDINGN